MTPEEKKFLDHLDYRGLSLAERENLWQSAYNGSFPPDPAAATKKFVDEMVKASTEDLRRTIEVTPREVIPEERQLNP